MARRGRFKRFVRRSTRSAFRRGTRKGTSMGWGFLLGAGLYGAGREKVSNFLAPYTNKIPLGNITDEVVMGTLGYFAMKKGSGIVRDVGKAAMTIEAARIGETLVSGSLNLNTSQSQNNQDFGNNVITGTW